MEVVDKIDYRNKYLIGHKLHSNRDGREGRCAHGSSGSTRRETMRLVAKDPPAAILMPPPNPYQKVLRKISATSR